MFMLLASILAKTLNSVFNDRGPEIRDRFKELKCGETKWLAHKNKIRRA